MVSMLQLQSICTVFGLTTQAASAGQEQQRRCWVSQGRWIVVAAAASWRAGRRHARDDGMWVDGAGLGFWILWTSGAEDVDPR